MSRPRTLLLTPTQSRLHSFLLTSATGPDICRVLRIKPSQLANRCKDVYTKLGCRDRVDLMGQELTCQLAELCRLRYKSATAPTVSSPPSSTP